MTKHCCSIFVETGPLDHDGWRRGLSIRVDVGEEVEVRIFHARRYISADRTLQMLFHESPAAIEHIDPQVSLQLVRDASNALRSEGVDLDAAAVLAAAE